MHRWLEGDASGPAPPEARRHGRNHDWPHFAASDILSMPDKWEYPWFAAWDTAFHVVPLAMIDPDFAKDQLLLLMREWYMHPNGQIPAYEWSFGDVNPPVHAWAAIRVYQIEGKIYGRSDRAFLERAFQKLLINFTWWVNRKDAEGNNIFEGGFLGLDNIGAFDRSSGLPSGGRLEQADGTSWMATYCLNLLAISLELAREDPVYEDVATKFFEHFVYIGAAVNRVGGREGGLWHDDDGFYFDALKLPDGRCFPIRANTVAGFIPLAGDRGQRARQPAQVSRLRPAVPMVPRVPPGSAGRPRRSHAPRHGTAAAPRPRRFGQAPAHPRASCSTRGDSSARTAFARCRNGMRSIRSSSPWMASASCSTTSPGNRPRRSSAATRTGAGRYGSRSISC